MFHFKIALFVGLISIIESQKPTSFLPTMIWDRSHPLFQCDEPKFDLRAQDSLTVSCANSLVHDYQRDSVTSNIPSTRLLYVGTEEEYNKCDISAAKSLLICNEKEFTSNTKRLCNNGFNCTNYYRFVVIDNIPVPISLEKGKTHHFIGVEEQTNGQYNTKPCLGNTKVYERSMKFKVYVCTDEEEKQGKCQPCKTEGCYYARCQKKCGEWKDSSSSIFEDNKGNCFKHQEKECTSTLLSTTTKLTKEVNIPCPALNCDQWRTSDLVIYEDGVCYRSKSRPCTDFRGNRTQQNEKEKIPCPDNEKGKWKPVEKITRLVNNKEETCVVKERRFCTFYTEGSRDGKSQVIVEERNNPNCTTATVAPPTVLGAQASRKEEDDKNLYIYIAIAASIISMVLGICIGFLLTKCCQRNSQSVEVIKTIEKVVPVEGVGPIIAYENKNFHLDPVLEDPQQAFNLADIEFIPATIGTTKRQVMVARSVSFYDPEAPNGQYVRRNSTKSEGPRKNYRPPSNIKESNRNVMRHPSATSKTVLIRHHSDVTERPRSDSDTSVFDLKQPDDCKSEQV